VTFLTVVVLVLVAAGGTLVVLTRDPFRQAVVVGVYGMVLTVSFLVLQAPDVALSISAVSIVALPSMLLLTLAKVRGDRP
jgi:uncharacterized MnhB-related membrane protein